MKTNITDQDLLQTLNDLKEQLKAKGWTLRIINAHNTKDGTVWSYQIKVPGLCFSKAEEVISEITLFWDFNRIEDHILLTSLDYIRDLFYITWEVSC